MYFQGKDENWIKRTFGEQCKHEDLFGRCQGLKGHTDDHWHYSPDGHYNYAVNKENLRDFDVAAGSIPPGHKDYVHPKDMASKVYRNHFNDEIVTDPEVLNRLENGELEDGESMTRSVKIE